MTDSNPTGTPCLTFCSPELSLSYSIILLLFSGLLSQPFSLHCGYFLHVALRVVGHSLAPEFSFQLSTQFEKLSVILYQGQMIRYSFCYNEPAFSVTLIIFFILFYSDTFLQICFSHSRNILLPGSFLSVKNMVSSFFALGFFGARLFNLLAISETALFPNIFLNQIPACCFH